MCRGWIWRWVLAMLLGGCPKNEQRPLLVWTNRRRGEPAVSIAMENTGRYYINTKIRHGDINVQFKIYKSNGFYGASVWLTSELLAGTGGSL